MARLAVCLLGSIQVHWQGEPLTRLPTDKTRALLAYLAVESQCAHRRDALAELFWPMRPQSAALNNLRQTLYLLRGTIHDRETDPPYLFVTHDEIQFNIHSDFWLDINQFETALMGCFSHHPDEQNLCAACLQRLRTTIELFRGEFLAGLSLPDCPEFDWWLLARQETYHRLALQALDRLARHFEHTRDYLQVSQYAQKAIELEPWRESSHRIKMRAQANSGNPQEALRQFELCKDILNQELGVDPSIETTRLYEKIFVRATGKTINRPHHIQIPASGKLGTSPQLNSHKHLGVGRTKELGQLTTYLEQAVAGSGRVAVVTGEAGSGKSTLVSKFTHQVLTAFPDLLVAVGSCQAYNGRGDTYTPFIQILRRLNGEVGLEQQALFQDADYDQRLRKAQYDFASAISTFGAQWAKYLTPGASPAEQDQAHNLTKFRSQKTRPRSQNFAPNKVSPVTNLHPDQIGLFDQYVQALRSLASHHPLVLVLEDLHWADSGTLGLLFHLGRNLTGRRILLIGTYRSEELLTMHLGSDKAFIKHPALRPILKEFQLMYGDIEVDLDQSDGRLFIRDLLASLPNRLAEDFRATLYQYSQGHALFTVELLRSLQARGEIVLDPEGYWTADTELHWDFFPTKVEAIIADRLSRLTLHQHELLKHASIQGEIFCPQILARITGLSSTSIQRNLSELANVQRLICAENLQWQGEDFFSSYRFCQTLYQRYLYHTIDLVDRKRLHAATALEFEALSSGPDRPDTSDLLRLAWHYEAAGQVMQAAQTLHKAGRQAYLAGANTEAIGHFKRALVLLSGLPATPERDVLELSLQLGLSAPLRTGRGYADKNAGRAYARAGELALRLGDTNKYCLASFLLHSYYTSRAEYQRAMEISRRLDDLTKEKSQAGYRPLANFCLGLTNLLLGKFAPAREQLSAASVTQPPQNGFQLISPIGHDVCLLSRTFLTLLYWMDGDSKKAQHTSQSALLQAQSHRHLYSQAFILAISGCIVNLFGHNYCTLQSHIEELLQLSNNSGFDVLHALAVIFSGRMKVAYGEYELGLQELQAGLLAYQSTGHKMLRTFLLGLLAEACLESGELQQGLEMVLLAEHTLLECGERFYEAELRRIKAGLLLALAETQATQDGRLFLEQAENCLRRSMKIARWQGARAFELRAALDYCKYLLAQGHSQKALFLLEYTYSSFRAEVDLPELLEAGRLLAELTDNEVP